MGFKPQAKLTPNNKHELLVTTQVSAELVIKHDPYTSTLKFVYYHLSAYWVQRALQAKEKLKKNEFVGPRLEMYCLSEIVVFDYPQKVFRTQGIKFCTLVKYIFWPMIQTLIPMLSGIRARNIIWLFIQIISSTKLYYKCRKVVNTNQYSLVIGVLYYERNGGCLYIQHESDSCKAWGSLTEQFFLGLENTSLLHFVTKKATTVTYNR